MVGGLSSDTGKVSVTTKGNAQTVIGKVHADEEITLNTSGSGKFFAQEINAGKKRIETFASKHPWWFALIWTIIGALCSRIIPH